MPAAPDRNSRLYRMVLFLEDEKVHERRPWEQKRPNIFSALPPRTSINACLPSRVLEGQVVP